MYYWVKASEYCVDTTRKSTVYGIEYNDDKRHIIVDDITTDYKRLERLVMLCNELELDVSQLNEVIEDFLSE